MHFLRNLRNNLVSRAHRDFLCNRFLPISDGITQMSNCSFREIEVSYAIGVNLSACQHEEKQKSIIQWHVSFKMQLVSSVKDTPL